jgi:hypothetical protein
MPKMLATMPKGNPLTLEQAVIVLNDRRHHGHSCWYISGGTPKECFVLGRDQYEFFEPFEAMAIAEKYARQRGKGRPAAGPDSPARAR